MSSPFSFSTFRDGGELKWAFRLILLLGGFICIVSVYDCGTESGARQARRNDADLACWKSCADRFTSSFTGGRADPDSPNSCICEVK